MTSVRVLALSGAALGLSACAIGPNYKPPVPPTAAAGAFVSADPRISTVEATRADWWRLYDVGPLDRLVQQALQNNTDLRQAAANLAEARAALRTARADFLPDTTASGLAQYGQQRANPQIPSPPEGWTYTAGLDVSYEVDLLGRIRRGVQAAKADYEARAAAQDAVRVTVAAETTRAYLNACGYAQQAEVARRTLALLDQSYDIIARQRDLGALSDYEVSLTGGLREQARAQIPQFEAQRKSALFQLAVLTGRPPSEISQDAAACASIPRLAAPLPIGDGAALLRRRPDVRQAERSLEASVARIGVATADLFPRVSLGGSVSESDGPVQTGLAFNVGPLISWSFPNILAARARLQAAEARSQGALAAFDGTVLGALREVEQSLTLYSGELDRNTALANARDQSADALRIANVRYEQGSTSFLNLIDAQRALVQAESQLAASSFNLAENQVAVFKALGGGWEQAPAVTVAARR